MPLFLSHYFFMTRTILSTPNGTKLGNTIVDWSSPTFLSLSAMITLGQGTGFRKSEVALPDNTPFDDRRLRRSSLLWLIDGVLHADPPTSLLQNLTPLRDMAVIKPPRSKADQDGTIFGTLPIYQAYDPSDSANSAARLRSIELAHPLHGPSRSSTPLFFTTAHSFQPITHSTVDRLLGHLLQLHFPTTASSYSFHSFRIGFACCLLAAGCAPGTIQALARWSSPASLAIYARINPEVYASWVAKSLSQDATSITTRRLPIIDRHNAIATFSTLDSRAGSLLTTPPT
jgi:hypothetical protein